MSSAGHEPSHLPAGGEIFKPQGYLVAIPVEVDGKADDSSSDVSPNPTNEDLLHLADRFPAPQE